MPTWAHNLLDCLAIYASLGVIAFCAYSLLGIYLVLRGDTEGPTFWEVVVLFIACIFFWPSVTWRAYTYFTQD